MIPAPFRAWLVDIAEPRSRVRSNSGGLVPAACGVHR